MEPEEKNFDCTTDEGYRNTVEAIANAKQTINQYGAIFGNGLIKGFLNMYADGDIDEFLDNLYIKATDIYNTAVEEKKNKAEQMLLSDGCEDSECYKCRFNNDGPMYDSCDECPYSGDDSDEFDNRKYAAECAYDYMNDVVYEGEHWDPKDEKNRKVMKALADFMSWIIDEGR